MLYVAELWTDFMTDLLNGIPLEQIQARINAAQIQFPKRMCLWFW